MDSINARRRTLVCPAETRSWTWARGSSTRRLHTHPTPSFVWRTCVTVFGNSAAWMGMMQEEMHYYEVGGGKYLGEDP